eukprot:scaffold77265_cov18-Prasinocladus_malaysianus.AAC.2
MSKKTSSSTSRVRVIVRVATTIHSNTRLPVRVQLRVRVYAVSDTYGYASVRVCFYDASVKSTIVIATSRFPPLSDLVRTAGSGIPPPRCRPNSC